MRMLGVTSRKTISQDSRLICTRLWPLISVGEVLMIPVTGEVVTRAIFLRLGGAVIDRYCNLR